MDSMDILLPMLIGIVIGIVGFTAAVTWMIAKSRFKDKVKMPDATPAQSALRSSPVEPHFLAVDHTAVGAWAISINGETYTSLQAVPDDTVRQEVLAGLRELASFARSYIQKGPVKPTPVAAQDAKPAAAPVAPAQETGTVTPPERSHLTLRSESALRRSNAAPVLMPSIDLAREIGDIVAEIQVRIPSLAGRSIRIQNALDGGIQFAIDGIVYPDVASIPDRDIQALIRAATQEWESR